MILFLFAILDTIGLAPDNPITTTQLWIFVGILFIAIVGILTYRAYQRRSDREEDQKPTDMEQHDFDYAYREKYRDASEQWVSIFARAEESPYQVRVYFLNAVQRFLGKYLDVFFFNAEIRGGNSHYTFKQKPILKNLYTNQWDVYQDDAYIGKFKMKFKLKEMHVRYEPVDQQEERIFYQRTVMSTKTKATVSNDKVLEADADRFAIRTNHRVNITTQEIDPAFLLGLYHLTILVRNK
ncbi:hypothetical protein [Oceanobacillus manasiensis]|uniref:hypothetical protein n=1 Tax=Oceanobacillus manasiensis TaxID=586413 RepID=UPI0005A6FCEE|nr:hypothetical protein [Oceanobacillus manasiensis]